MYNNYRKWRNHKVVATRMINNHPPGKAEWLFFIAYVVNTR